MSADVAARMGMWVLAKRRFWFGESQAIDPLLKWSQCMTVGPEQSNGQVFPEYLDRGVFHFRVKKGIERAVVRIPQQ